MNQSMKSRSLLLISPTQGQMSPGSKQSLSPNYKSMFLDINKINLGDKSVEILNDDF